MGLLVLAWGNSENPTKIAAQVALIAKPSATGCFRKWNSTPYKALSMAKAS